MWGDTLLLRGWRSQPCSACPPSALAAGWSLGGGRRPPANARPSSHLHYPTIFPAAAMWGLLSFSFFSPHPSTPFLPLPPMSCSPTPQPRPHPWPLVALSTCPATGSSLTHECGRGRGLKAWTPTEGSRICNSNLLTDPPPRLPANKPTSAHAKPYPRAHPVIASDWRRAYMNGETHMTRRCEPTHIYIDSPPPFFQ